MKRTKYPLLVMLGGLFIALSSFSEGNPGPGKGKKPAQKSAIRTVIIDPGHGGFDTGTKGLYSKEAAVALAVSIKLGKAMAEEFPDIKQVFTRTTDIMPGGGNTIASGLNYRADLANKSRGDLFIAVHCNNDGHPAGPFTIRRIVGHKYVGKGKKRRRVPIYQSYTGHHTRKGTESYIWKADRSGFKGTAIGQRGEGEGEMDATDSTGESNTDSTAFDMSSPEAMMRAQLYEKKYFGNSALFATLVEEEFTKAGRISGGVNQRDEGIRVLQATGMPSVLVEIGFLSNVEEENYLNSDEGQDEIVRNIMDAFRRYKATLEGHPANNDATGSNNR
ncbi:MAG TPA: N-acetylmuramoyl-L-alanine amidase [Puia sp.]